MEDSIRDQSDVGSRGVQYPADGLEVVLAMLERVRDAVGFSPASRETLAEALGYRTLNGTSSRKLANLSHFEVVTRVGKGSYRISDLGKRLLLPTTDNDKKSALVEAATKPTLFAQVFSRFKGHSLPTLLPNLLTREFGVFHGSAEDAAKAFRDSMEFAGLLRNGVLHEDVPDEIDKSPAVVDRSSVSKDGGDQVASAAEIPPNEFGRSAASTQTYTIPLDGSGRVASIAIPLPVEGKDVAAIERWAAYMKLVIGE